MGEPEWLRGLRRGLSAFAVWPWQQGILSGQPHGSDEKYTFNKILFGNQWFSAFCLVSDPKASSSKFKKKNQEKQVYVYLTETLQINVYRAKTWEMKKIETTTNIIQNPRITMREVKERYCS